MGYSNNDEQVDEFVRQRRQEIVENKKEIAAVMCVYTGALMLTSGGLLPPMSPVIDAGDTLITASNLSVDKIANNINDAKLHKLFNIDDINEDRFDEHMFMTALRVMDLGYRYADAEKYYRADPDCEKELITPADGVAIKAESMAVYKDNDMELAVVRTPENEFYIRQITSDDYDNMRECTYDEFNPWHKDVSQSLQDNGEDYTNIQNIKTLSVERQQDGGEPGKINTTTVNTSDVDSYDVNSLEGSSTHERYEARIKAHLAAIDTKQAVEDSVEAKREQDELNRMFYGRKAAKYM